MYRPLWEKASDQEKLYLLAMARLSATEGVIETSRVSNCLGKTFGNTAFLRQRLILKGLIHGLKYGILEFSYPGFNQYISTLILP